MKKIILFILLLTAKTALSQCNLENIVPVKLGMTKFDARNAINATNNYYKEPYAEAFETPITIYPKSLGGLSVKKEVLSYVNKNNFCFYSKKMELMLRFLDDVLYKVEFSSEFTESEYNNFINQFQKITNLLDNLYSKYKENWETTNSGDKVGQSNVYLLSNDNKNYHRFTIGFTLKSNIYTLTYEEVNLRLTKIKTTDGF